MVGWIKRKHDLTICPLSEHFRPKDTNRLKAKRCENTFHTNNQKRAEKIDFISKKFIKDYILIKDSKWQEDITSINITDLKTDHQNT